MMVLVEAVCFICLFAPYSYSESRSFGVFICWKVYSMDSVDQSRLADWAVWYFSLWNHICVFILPMLCLRGHKYIPFKEQMYRLPVCHFLQVPRRHTAVHWPVASLAGMQKTIKQYRSYLAARYYFLNNKLRSIPCVRYWTPESVRSSWPGQRAGLELIE